MENLNKLLDMIKDKNLLSYLFTILLTAVVTYFMTDFFLKRDEIKELKSDVARLQDKYEKKENISIELSDQKNETKSKKEDLRRKDEDISELKKDIGEAEANKKKLAEELEQAKNLIDEKNDLIYKKDQIIQNMKSCQNDPALLKLISERDKLLDRKGIHTVRNYSNSGERKPEAQNEEESRMNTIRDFNNQINEMKKASGCIN
ncbi:hypothetical protein [Acinetobacter calcoaceticus]|uniref:Chromosome segregation ATPase n=1 Tax=Acinetobacter calcoaceticus TaxID=471 RepID=A0ABD5AKX9_ACICA|nr:hypothetical protein [Acinetobacter calcoaceticus]MDP9803156.1 chromosome segregation ATPase [Acinetobacter calcoaceticus]